MFFCFFFLFQSLTRILLRNLSKYFPHKWGQKAPFAQIIFGFSAEKKYKGLFVLFPQLELEHLAFAVGELALEAAAAAFKLSVKGA